MTFGDGHTSSEDGRPCTFVTNKEEKHNCYFFTQEDEILLSHECSQMRNVL